ncbi:MAG: HYR domain-containing protein, partial [Flavobacteriales bacterium]|nr:HYR domain-containing protein [Flavobacteriales bacterium]
NDFNGTADASDTYPLGTTTVTWTVTDASGNTAICTQDITVTDDEDPTITCAADQTQSADVGLCTAAVTVIPPGTADNCSVASVVNDFNGTADASDTYPLGTTIVTWTVTDGSGNTAICTQDITVTDDEDPVIFNCPTNIIQNADPSTCDAIVTWTEPTAVDNCTADLSANWTRSHLPGSTFLPGTTTVTYSVNDDNGNTSSLCQFDVIITDVQPNLSIDDPVVSESDGTATFNLVLSSTYCQDIVVTYGTNDVSTTAGSDYLGVIPGMTKTIPAGDLIATIDITINEDNIYELSETFELNISGVTNVSGFDAQAIGTITDNEAYPELSIADNSTLENTGSIDLIVSLNNPSYQNISFEYLTNDITAISPNDFNSVLTTLVTIPAGSNSVPLTFVINDDNIFEPNENFEAVLANETNALLTDGQGIATILNDEAIPCISVSNVNVTEANTNMDLTVTTDIESSADITFNFSTSPNDATPGSDYSSTSGSGTISTNSMSTVISVPILDDVADESNETFDFTISSPTVATICPAQGTALGTILDDDGTPDLFVNDIMFNEADGLVNIVIGLTNPSASNVTFDHNINNITTTSIDDHDLLSSTGHTIPAGMTTYNIPFTIVDDLCNELNETFEINLTNAVNAGLGDDTGSMTIIDNDATPELCVNSVSVNETAGTATLTVSLSAVSCLDVTFDYSTSDGVALDPTDYDLTAGTATITAGNPSIDIDIPINDDLLDEIDESFDFNLSSPVNATIGAGCTGVVTILDDDVTPCLSIDDITQDESISAMTFTIALDAVSGQDVTVDYDVTEITASNGGTDFTASPTTVSLTIPEGTASITVVVPINDDVLNEIDETFEIALSNPGAATLCVGSEIGTGTITDDDAPPCISIDDVTQDESLGTMTFTIALDAVSGQDVTFDYTTTDITAANGGVDFNVATNGSMTIPEGTTSVSIVATVNDDALNEVDETFEIALSNPGAAILCVGSETGTGTITDNDATPCLSIFDVAASENVGIMDLTVNLSAASGSPVDFTYTLTDITTNTLATDYTNAPVVITIPAGTTMATVSIPINDDLLDEIDETFTVNLTGNVNADLCVGFETATGVIIDNDATPCVSIDNVTVDESVTPSEFTVTLDAISGQDVTVNYSIADVTTGTNATIDASLPSTSVIIPEGSISATFPVTIIEDLLDEMDETYTITLGSIANGTVCSGMGTGTGTITDNDATPCLSIDDISIAENAGSMTFTLTLDNVSGQDVSVDYNLIDITATNGGVDLTATPSGTVLIAEGSTSNTIVVTLNDDVLAEGNETFDIVLDPPTAASLCPGNEVGTGTILDNESVPNLSMSDVSYDETDGTVIFTIISTGLSASDITFDVTSIDGSAIGGIDFDIISGSATILAGTNNYDVIFDITDDALFEFDENFTIEITNIVGANMLDTDAEVTIVSDDAMPCISIDPSSTTEASPVSWMLFSINLDAPSGEDVTFDVNYTDISTHSSADLDFNPGTIPSSIMIPAGSTSFNFNVMVIDDLYDEMAETFSIDLSNAVNAAFCTSSAIGTIIDDDPVPCVSVNNLTASEADGIATFTFTLDAASGQDIDIEYYTADGNAENAADYSGGTAWITIPEGDLTYDLDIPILEDVLSEADETFTMNMNTAINANICGVAGIATITDNDPSPTISIDDVTANEGDGTMSFTIALSAVSGQDTYVDHTINDISAVNGGVDYTGITLDNHLIPAGSISKTIVISINDDLINETDENFEIVLSNPIGATIDISNGVGTGTIQDNDIPPTISVSPNASVNESAGSIDVVVSLSSISGQDVTFSYNQTDNSALNTLDYTSNINSATIVAGSMSTIITIAILEDALDEIDEEFWFNIYSPINASLGVNQQTIQILDNDSAPVISIAPVSQDESIANMTFTMSIDAVSSLDVSADYVLSDITSTSGLDHGDPGIPVTLTVLAGDLSTTFSVPIINDALNEIDETFAITLSNPINGIIMPGSESAIGEILDNDPIPCISINNVTANEGDVGMSFTVALNFASGQTISVNYDVSDNTATNGTDLIASASGTLTFLPGETAKSIPATLIDDIISEGAETFHITLSSPTQASLCTGLEMGTGTILDNETSCLYITDPTSVSESDGSVTFTVYLTSPSGSDVTFDYTTAANSALVGDDFVFDSGTRTIAAGNLSEDIVISINNDLMNEDPEDFKLVLSNILGGVFCTLTEEGTVIINDDDAMPELCIDGSISVDEDAGAASMNISLSATSGLPVSVDYQLDPLTATAALDYDPSGGTIIFAPGELVKNISIPIVSDLVDELNETFNVSLTNATNASVSLGCSNTTTIIDKNEPVAICQDISVYVDNDGLASIQHDTIYAGSNISGTIVSYFTNDTAFTCADIPSFFPVTLTVTDNNGDTGSCNATIFVQDTIAPSITCLDTIIALNDLGVATLNGIDLTDNYSDNCSVSTPTILNGSYDCSNLGAPLIVTVSVADGSGNLNSCISNVTVIDSIAPEITCPSDVTIDTDPGTNTANYIYSPPVVIENCIDSIVQTDLTGLTSNSNFPMGNTIQEYTVYSASGDTASCSFTVTVEDNEPPVANCQLDFDLDLDASGDASINISDIENGSTDNDGIASITISNNTFDCSDIGPNDIWLVIEDNSGNLDSCLTVVTINDITPPAMSCENNITMPLDNDGMLTLIPADLDINTSDVCDGIDLTLSLDHTTFDCTSLGDTLITMTALDQSGNSNTCSTTVTIIDDMAPEIICQGATLVLDSLGNATLDPLALDAGTTDNCEFALSVSKETFDCSDIGVNSVTLYAFDTSGNIDSCLAAVTLVGDIAAELTCPSNIDTIAEIGICSVDLTIDPLLVIESCSYTVTNDLNTNGTDISGTYPVGSTLVTFTVTNSAGNVSTCTTEINVVDDQIPFITCPNDTTVYISPTLSYVEFEFGDPEHGDNCTDFLFTQTSGLASGAQFPIGTDTISFSIVDVSNNEFTCSYVVTVLDTIAPVIDLENVIACEGWIDVPIPDVYDNSGEEINIFNDLTGTDDASSDLYPEGETTVVWTAIDTYGNITIDTSYVEMWAMPEAPNAGADQVLFFKNSTYLEGNEYPNTNSYWDLLNGSGNIVNDTIHNTQVTNLPVGTHILSWNVDNGVCLVQSDTMIIQVKEIIVPNAISPDNDGTNDALVIEGIENFDNEVIVYNRWGQTLYKAKNYQNDWYGTGKNGKTLPPDTYYYIVKLDELKDYAGFLVIKYKP